MNLSEQLKATFQPNQIRLSFKNLSFIRYFGVSDDR